MKKFEYKTVKQVSPANVSDVVDVMNMLGQDGWELVEKEYGFWFFKREVPEPAPVKKEQDGALDRRREMFQHMKDVHDTTVLIGNPHLIHSQDHPDCDFQPV